MRRCSCATRPSTSRLAATRGLLKGKTVLMTVVATRLTLLALVLVLNTPATEPDKLSGALKSIREFGVQPTNSPSENKTNLQRAIVLEPILDQPNQAQPAAK